MTDPCRQDLYSNSSSFSNSILDYIPFGLIGMVINAIADKFIINSLNKLLKQWSTYILLEVSPETRGEGQLAIRCRTCPSPSRNNTAYRTVSACSGFSFENRTMSLADNFTLVYYKNLLNFFSKVQWWQKYLQAPNPLLLYRTSCKGLLFELNL